MRCGNGRGTGGHDVINQQKTAFARAIRANECAAEVAETLGAGKVGFEETHPLQ